MGKLSHTVIRHKKLILTIFLAVTMVCAVFALQVRVNYNMVDYLPEDAQSTTAIKIMENEFEGEVSDARIMLADVSIREALEYKRKIESIDGVSAVTWLDDIIGLNTLETTPLDFLDISILKNYYKDNHALMNLSVERGKEKVAVNAIYELIGQDNAAAGKAFNTAETQSMTVSEVTNAMLILIPVIFIVLIISTTSWVEPLLFLFTIGIAVVINMGTNFIFGEVSYITRTVSPVLQLAVSLDYAVFLLHSFNDNRLLHKPHEAMLLAMKQAFPTIAASAATTVIGFAALVFMRFGIGADLGLNLVKGVLLSFISVMLFLPVVILICYKAIDKTKHGKFLPDFKKTGNFFMKTRIPFLILSLIVVIPCFLAQMNTGFTYGMGSITNATRIGKDTSKIEEKFGKENVLVLLVPKENAGKEAELCDTLSKIPHVTGVLAFVTVAGKEIPQGFVPEEVTEQFYSENFTRVILYTDTTEEGTDAFNTVQTVLDRASMHYNTYYLSGQSATLYDMKNVVSSDTKLVNLIAAIGIFIVLLITTRSLIIPFLLLFTIETAIWINLSFPYFTGRPLSFIGYLIVSAVQLGATVDYAILYTNCYLVNRKTLSKKEAMAATIRDNLVSILVSATILSTAGFALAFTSTNPIISELGTLFGRGALLSFIMVAFVLPALLVMFDKVIQKTTLKHYSNIAKL